MLSISPCNLCPRACAAPRAVGVAGVCGADDRLLVARAALHFWEEPPLSGLPREDGTRAGSGAIFFVNCPLHCVFCQNAVIAEGGYGVSVSIDRLAQIMLELQGQGALNINCVTPTHYALHIMQAVRTARVNGLQIPVVWNTSGYETVEAVRALADTVDVYLDDFKYASSEVAARYSHASDYPQVALAALDAMVDTAGAPAFDEVDGQPRMTRGVVVRHLLLPGEMENSRACVKLLHDRYGDNILLSIMNQYTPVLASAAEAGDARAQAVLKKHPHLAQKVPDEDYERLLDYADSIGCDDYFWQVGPAAKESFVPAWDGTGVV